MVLVVPPCSNRLLHTHTVLVLLVKKTKVYCLELLFVGLEAVAGVAVLLGSVRRVFFLHSCKEGFFFLQTHGGQSKGLDDSSPFLAHCHLHSFQSLFLSAFPPQQGSLVFRVSGEGGQFVFEDGESVVLFLGDLGNEGVDEGEHLPVEFFSVLLGSVDGDGCVNEVELSFEDAVGRFFGEAIDHNFYEFVRSHPGVLHHFEEASPNEGPAQDVLDRVDVLDEEVQGNGVDDVLGEGVILEIQQNGLVVPTPIVLLHRHCFRQHQHFHHVHLHVLLEKPHFDLVQSQRRVLSSEETLLYGDLGVDTFVFGAPLCLQEVERSFVEPEFSPLLQGKLSDGELFLHLCQELIDGGIAPLILGEVLAKGLPEVLLLHEVQELLHGGCSLGIGDPVEDRISHAGVLDPPSDGVSGDHLVLVVAPPLPLQEGRHGRLVVDSLAVVLDLLEAEVGNEVCEAFVEPQVVPPLHGDQVPEPVVREFVGDGVGEGEEAFGGDFFFEDVEVVEGDDSCVFHGSPAVLVGEDLVVLVEGEGEVEEAFEEAHRLDSDFEDEGRQVLHVLEEGLDAKDGHRDVLNRPESTLYSFSFSNFSYKYSPAMKQYRQLGSNLLSRKIVIFPDLSFKKTPNSPLSPVLVPFTYSPSQNSFSTTGFSLESTFFHSGGEITARRMCALRSGWSKQGNTRFAQQGSNWVQMYCFWSTSTKLTQPLPSLLYSQAQWTPTRLGPTLSWSMESWRKPPWRVGGHYCPFWLRRVTSLPLKSRTSSGGSCRSWKEISAQPVQALPFWRLTWKSQEMEPFSMTLPLSSALS